jgi:DNA-binding NtrC family response regulator
MIVDDEEGVRVSYDRFFSGHGFDVETAVDGHDAVSHLKEAPVDVVVADLKMPGMNGIQLLEWIHDAQPETQFILLTGYGNEQVEETVRKLGAYEYLNKPISPDTLAAVVTAAMHLQTDVKKEVTEAVETEVEAAPEPEAVTVKGPARRTVEILVGLVVAPILGLLFVMFLPVIGFGALFWTLGQTVKDLLKKPAHV